MGLIQSDPGGSLESNDAYRRSVFQIEGDGGRDCIADLFFAGPSSLVNRLLHKEEIAYRGWG